MQDLRYPIGPFEPPGRPLTPAERETAIERIAATPAELRHAVEGLDDEQLDTPYRPEGWTVRQVVHHLPDSHVNSYIRFKLGLTEECPTLRTYEEARWSELPDAREPVAGSLDLLEALHRRLVVLLRALGEEDWARTVHHPEGGTYPLDTQLAIYAWHGPHHVAHVTELRRRRGW